jgi:5'-methylthioadenosine phosphorylase
LIKTLLAGGTGFTELDYLEDPHPKMVRTPFGGTTIYLGTYQGIETGFLPRHGMNHEHLAHQVNYRASVWAARELGFDRILGTSAVAALNPEIKVGDLVLLDQLVDFTEGREATFNLRSAPMTEPFCSEMRASVLHASSLVNVTIHPRATYICFRGPRYETAAEIQVFKRLGMDVVGMTNATEASLCRELGICFVVIALVTNMGAGLGELGPNLERHRQVTLENLPRFKTLTLQSLVQMPQTRECNCKN